MARIAYPDVKELPPELYGLLKQANLNVFTMWAHSENTIDLIMRLGAAQFAKLELPRATREMATLLGARANSAEYEWVQHIPLSKAAGVSDEQRTALWHRDVDASCFSPAEKAALRFAAAVLASPQVNDATFNAAREHLTDRELVELVGIVGYYWMLGRIATVFDVDLDPPKDAGLYDVGLQVVGPAPAHA